MKKNSHFIGALAAAAASYMIPNTQAHADTIIPVVVYAPGTAGSFYASNVTLYNPTSTTLEGELVFTPMNVSAGGPEDRVVQFILPGKNTKLYTNVYQLDNAGAQGAGRLLVRMHKDPATGNPYPDPIADSSTANLLSSGGKLTLSVEPVRPTAFYTRGKTLAATLGEADERTNLFISTGNEDTTIQFTYRDSAGTTLSTKNILYPRNGTFQDNQLQGVLGSPPQPNSSLEAKIVSGSAVVAITPINNMTSDGRWKTFKEIN